MESSRLRLFTGKGGVGKTTMARAVAMAEAEQGRTVALIEIADLKPDEEIREYIVRALTSGPRAGAAARTFAALLTGSRVARRFFAAAPGVVEVAMYDRIWRAMQDNDVVLVDLESSGHARMFLELSTVLDGVLGQGPMRERIDRLSHVLRDSCDVVLVTVPEPVPVAETEELYQSLTNDLGMSVALVVANRTEAAWLASETDRGSDKDRGPDKDGREDVADAPTGSSDAQLLELARNRDWERTESLSRLGTLPVPVSVVHEQPLDEHTLLATGRQILDALGDKAITTGIGRA